MSIPHAKRGTYAKGYREGQRSCEAMVRRLVDMVRDRDDGWSGAEDVDYIDAVLEWVRGEKEIPE